MLLGAPIPFSNLGKIIPELLLVQGPPAGRSLGRLGYLKTNVDQVMTYLRTYRGQGGQLPLLPYERIKASYQHFLANQTRALSPAGVDSVLSSGCGCCATPSPCVSRSGSTST